MQSTRKLWIGLAALLAGSFAVLLFVGGQIYRQAPLSQRESSPPTTP